VNVTGQTASTFTTTHIKQWRCCYCYDEQQ
jgi:hypothetical protein